MSTASVSSTSRAPTGSNCGGDSTTASITGSQISIITDPYSNPRVHFSDSIDRSFDDEEEELRFSPGPIGSSGYSDKPTSHRSSSSPRSAACPTTVEYTPQETINYSGKYLSPLENNRANLSRSSPNSPAGSNISIIGSLISPCRKMGVSSGGNAPWKLRARFSKRRGKDRSTDRERDRDHDRQPSVCSDSETDSLTGVNSYRGEEASA